MEEYAAIQTLVAMSANQSTPSRPTTSNDAQTTGSKRSLSLSNTPEKKFKAAGYTRVRPGLINVLFQSSEGDTMVVPLAKGDTSDVFDARRQKTADLLFDSKRKVAYCQFIDQVINMNIEDPRWVLFRESTLQRRYHYLNVIQLIVTRTTCSHGSTGACRNCKNPHFRSGCLSPSHIYHVLPLPLWKNSVEVCKKMLECFEPVHVDADISYWTSKMPQMQVR
jgi:hypothetical protein